MELLKNKKLLVIIGIIILIIFVNNQNKKEALVCTNNEPTITNSQNAQTLKEDYGISVFWDELDSDNIFYIHYPLERYCYKGIVTSNGCVYTVNQESECIPDPNAPNNLIEFNPTTMECIVHYIRTRANVKCRVTGKIFDYNIISEREQLNNCPDCNWFNMITEDDGGIAKIVNNINIYTFALSSTGGEITYFCSNNQIKMTLNEQYAINYLTKYISCQEETPSNGGTTTTSKEWYEKPIVWILMGFALLAFSMLNK